MINGSRRAYELAKKVVAVAGIGYTIQQNVISMWKLSEDSMVPAFEDGDVALTTALNVKLKKGDVVIYKNPMDPTMKLCKRIVALPGDTVMRNSEDTMVVSKGKMWVEGDNGSKSIDSRDHGLIPMGLIEGVVICKMWPEFKCLKSPRCLTLHQIDDQE